MDSLAKLFSWLCCVKSSSSTGNDLEYGSTGKTDVGTKQSQQVQAVRIGAFNVKRLGPKKFDNAVVVEKLLQIISRFDLILIEEVQDRKLKKIPGFVEQLCKFSGQSYKYIVSDYLGRRNYKEQYLYIYREDVFEIADQFHYDDGSEELQEDTFEREPFIILVKSRKTSVQKFGVIGVHIRPDSVEKELKDMINVYEDVIKKWGNVPVIIMGDFNAGSSYISKTKLNKLTLRTDERFHWLLENQDTTVAKNDYTHDRIIVTGDLLKRCISPSTAKSFKFDEEFNLDRDEALEISDHYPVEFVVGKPLKDEL